MAAIAVKQLEVVAVARTLAEGERPALFDDALHHRGGTVSNKVPLPSIGDRGFRCGVVVGRKDEAVLGSVQVKGFTGDAFPFFEAEL
jgi:hypothetical protein